MRLIPAFSRTTILMATTLVCVLAGCTGAAPPVPVARHDDAPVVTTTGIGDIAFGDPRAGLVREHRLGQGPGDCHARLPAHPAVSPVFDGDRLVLLWADPPVRTADGLAVGSPVGQVRQIHPEAEELTAPAGSYRFDGLLVREGDRAFLFLHDQQQIRKLVVGYRDHVRLLFDEGFGTC